MRNFLHQAIEFRGRGLVNLGLFCQSEQTHGFQDAECTDAICIGSIFRRIKTHFYMAHCRQVIDLIRLCFLDDPDEVGRICQISIMKGKFYAFLVTVLVQMVDACCIEKGRTSFDAMYGISFFQEQLCEVCPVLSVNTCNQCNFTHVK